MIIKSLIILSIAFNSVGLSKLSTKFDDAVIRDRANGKKEVVASDISTIPLPEVAPRPKIRFSAPKAVANARHFILADPNSGVIFSKLNQNDHVPIASTTKIMTAIVALENYKLLDVVTISQAASTQIGADAFLRPGEKMTIENLLNCLLIKSGNDSAYAIAEHMNEPGELGTEKFVKIMNEKAVEIGMKNTNYKDPAGLDTTGYSSAYDLYLATRYAMKKEEFREIVKKEKWAAKNIDGTIWHELDNSNRLVSDYHYPGAIGVKTGYMPEAGHCLVGAAQRDGHTLISIVLNTYADTPTASADEARRLLDWGFNNIEWE